jgi:hypothetical protein
VAHLESLLVPGLGDDEAVRTSSDRLGLEPVAAANRYWDEHGLAFADPDGFRVVLGPQRRRGGLAPRRRLAG